MDETTAQIGLYTHRGQEETALSRWWCLLRLPRHLGPQILTLCPAVVMR